MSTCGGRGGHHPRQKRKGMRRHGGLGPGDTLHGGKRVKANYMLLTGSRKKANFVESGKNFY